MYNQVEFVKSITDDLYAKIDEYQKQVHNLLDLKIELLDYIIDLRTKEKTDSENAILNKISSIITKERK